MLTSGSLLTLASFRLALQKGTIRTTTTNITLSNRRNRSITSILTSATMNHRRTLISLNFNTINLRFRLNSRQYNLNLSTLRLTLLNNGIYNTSINCNFNLLRLRLLNLRTNTMLLRALLNRLSLRLLVLSLLNSNIRLTIITRIILLFLMISSGGLNLVRLTLTLFNRHVRLLSFNVSIISANSRTNRLVFRILCLGERFAFCLISFVSFTISLLRLMGHRSLLLRQVVGFNDFLLYYRVVSSVI